MKMMMLMVLLSTNIGWLHGNIITGVTHHCLNDYLFTFNCTLNIPPLENSSHNNCSYRLSFTETSTLLECNLTKTEGGYFCSLEKPKDSDTISEMDRYKISLCCNRDDESESCEVLEEEYSPVMNIQLNAPCCLTVSHNSSQHLFRWESTYEELSPHSGLPHDLQYELHCYKTQDKLPLYNISTERKHYSVNDGKFVPDTEFSARVRTLPNPAFYEAQWSHWSSEVHWKTQAASNDDPHLNKGELITTVFIPLLVTLLFFLLLCCVHFTRWKKNVFIPTPAPYFDTLYSDCQGDFKRWVITQEITAGTLKAEEMLQINTLTKCEDTQEVDWSPQCPQQLVEASLYSNISASPVGEAPLLGLPYAVSTMTPPLGQSKASLTLECEWGSSAGDSGCWLCSNTSLEKEPPWYCNEYCTLNSFHQAGCVAAEHPGSL